MIDRSQDVLLLFRGTSDLGSFHYWPVTGDNTKHGIAIWKWMDMNGNAWSLEPSRSEARPRIAKLCSFSAEQSQSSTGAGFTQLCSSGHVTKSAISINFLHTLTYTFTYLHYHRIPYIIILHNMCIYIHTIHNRMYIWNPYLKFQSWDIHRQILM